MRVNAFATLCVLVLAACGGDQVQADAGERTGSAGASVDPATLDPASITSAELALGDSLFHGLIGAVSCQACHGADAKGGTVAPDLTDSVWLHSNGSYGAIYHQIETGVMAPKQYTSMMPPFGGAQLTPAQHRAVAAYTYRLNHTVPK